MKKSRKTMVAPFYSDLQPHTTTCLPVIANHEDCTFVNYEEAGTGEKQIVVHPYHNNFPKLYDIWVKVNVMDVGLNASPSSIPFQAWK